jgi:hypothetical protein
MARAWRFQARRQPLTRPRFTRTRVLVLAERDRRRQDDPCDTNRLREHRRDQHRRWTISIIAILTVAVIAWKELGVKEDLERLRDRWRRGGR